MAKAAADEIRSQAIKEGMVTLRRGAIDKLVLGFTTVEEVIRITLEAGE